MVRRHIRERPPSRYMMMACQPQSLFVHGRWMNMTTTIQAGLASHPSNAEKGALPGVIPGLALASWRDPGEERVGGGVPKEQSTVRHGETGDRTGQVQTVTSTSSFDGRFGAPQAELLLMSITTYHMAWPLFDTLRGFSIHAHRVFLSYPAPCGLTRLKLSATNPTPEPEPYEPQLEKRLVPPLVMTLAKLQICSVPLPHSAVRVESQA